MLLKISKPRVRPPFKGVRLRLKEEARAAVRARLLPATPASNFHVGVRLDETNFDPAKQVNTFELVSRVVALAQALAEKMFYPYQTELAKRIVEALLDHDGDVVTALMSRQAGKTEVIGAVVAAVGVILPRVAKQFPGDWRLNLTDDRGVYRGYGGGIKTGIYAPRLDQAEIMFDRVRLALSTDTGKKVLSELHISYEENNGNTVKLSNGSRILCESASEQSKIEGATHNFLIAEEAQDISDKKIRKSLHPMVASTRGTIVKIGTATTQKCDFYDAIKTNQRLELYNGKRNNFFYPHTVVERYNSLYKKYVEGEALKLGPDSDEFLTSYCGKWIFERGMFVTDEQLFHRDVAQVAGIFSDIHDTHLLASVMPRRYSLVAGIDWGSSNDSTVVTLIAVDWSNPVESGINHLGEGPESYYTYYRKHIVSWMEFVGDNYEYQFEEIVPMLSSIPGLRRIVTDSNTCGKPIFDRLSSVFSQSSMEVVPFNFQQKIKSDGYKKLYGDICAKRVTFPASKTSRHNIRYRKFVNQMRDLRKTYRKGLMCVAHPEEKGAHDDYCDSFMMACWGADTEGVFGSLDVMNENPFLT